MKAIVRTQYGSLDVVRLADVSVPAPSENEVLVRIHAASVNPLDLFLVKGMPWNRIPGLRKPGNEILGCDVAGQVEAVGSKVQHFHSGDEVFGATGFDGNGFAEYACVPEGRLALKPSRLSFEEAAAMPIAAITALQALRDKGRLRSGHKVLIEGASGGVGTFAVQIAKALGAEVSAVCSSRNADQVRALGASHIIDYTKEDFTQSEQRYDLIVGVNAHHATVSYRRLLTQEGVYVAVGGGTGRILEAVVFGKLLSQLGKKTTTFFIANINRQDLLYLNELVETGKIRPIIDKRFTMDNAVEALRYLAEGHSQGKTVLTIAK
jgi:NADPH:quinone reductase-like Zn-dependent oxidoreductase